MLLRNFELEPYEDDRGKVKYRTLPIEARFIWANLKSVGGHYIKRVQQNVFANGSDKLVYFDTPGQLFGWIASQGVHVEWDKGRSMIGKDEFLKFLGNVAEEYDQAASYPHYPTIKGFYYINKIAAESNGSLDELCSRFSPATDKDAIAIKSMFMTPAWGGPLGCRPAFLILAVDDDERNGRGVGKTALTDAVALLHGGAVDLSRKTDDDEIRRRLMSARDIRVARLDNVKDQAFSSEIIESLITAPFLSGHRMFKGHDIVPNNFTFLITFNDAVLSEDLAQRVVTIRLKRGKFTPAWSEQLTSFIIGNRKKIYADIAHYLLDTPVPEISPVTRFPAWERDVLARCTENMVTLQQSIRVDADAVNDEVHKRDELTEFIIDKMATASNREPMKFALGFRMSWVVGWTQDFLGKGMSKRSARKLLLKLLPRGFLPEIKLYLGIEYLIWSPQRHESNPPDFFPGGCWRVFRNSAGVQSEEWNLGGTGFGGSIHPPKHTNPPDNPPEETFDDIPF